MSIDPVNNPKHYTDHPSGIECIEVTRHMSFNLGNAMKYIWRCDLKRDAVEDLKKAVWYLNDEIKKREGVDEEWINQVHDTSTDRVIVNPSVLHELIRDIQEDAIQATLDELDSMCGD